VALLSKNRMNAIRMSASSICTRLKNNHYHTSGVVTKQAWHHHVTLHPSGITLELSQVLEATGYYAYMKTTKETQNGGQSWFSFQTKYLQQQQQLVDLSSVRLRD
jgi:hypothetical protein